MENLDSDRIVGIRCDFNDNSPLFILSVYLPSASHPIEECNEYLDYLWALYDSLSKTGFVIVMGDFNGNLGNSLGERGHYAPNDRGVKLLDFANYFNLCPTNLLSTCGGPLETFVSHCGRFKSTIDYIFLPNCLFDSIVSSKVFEQTIDNTSDHLPLNPITYGGGLFGTDHQIIDHNSKTALSSTSKLGDFLFLSIRHTLAEF